MHRKQVQNWGREHGGTRRSAQPRPIFKCPYRFPKHEDGFLESHDSSNLDGGRKCLQKVFKLVELPEKSLHIHLPFRHRKTVAWTRTENNRQRLHWHTWSKNAWDYPSTWQNMEHLPLPDDVEPFIIMPYEATKEDWYDGQGFIDYPRRCGWTEECCNLGGCSNTVT